MTHWDLTLKLKRNMTLKEEKKKKERKVRSKGGKIKIKK